MFDHDDAEALAGELDERMAQSGWTPRVWMEAEGITEQAIVNLTAAGVDSLFQDPPRGRELRPVLQAILMGAFQLGWEAHKRYGKEE